jgi:hypothetical protein
VVALFDDLGFAPHRDPKDPARVELHACPSRELAVHHTEVVCGVHRGILKGALAEAGASTEGVELSPCVTPGMCFVRLARRAGQRDSVVARSCAATVGDGVVRRPLRVLARRTTTATMAAWSRPRATVSRTSGSGHTVGKCEACYIGRWTSPWW